MSPQQTDITDRRRFLISDAIVLVAAAALMLSADRAVHWIWSAFSEWFGDVPSWNQWETRRMAWSLALASLSLPLLCSLVVRPADRSRLRRGAPGLVVHLAIATVVAVRLAGWATQASFYALFEGRPGFYDTRWTVEVLNYLRDDLRKDAVIAILASWLSLKVVRRWNPEKAWDDRLGRFVGLLWVVFYLGNQLLALLP
jgi:hypothetical protein